MDEAPRFDSYEWRGGREAMLRFGPDKGPVGVFALPLFEEANRTRAFGVAILRALAQQGVGGALPEMPGQGESVVSTAETTLAMCQAGFAAAMEKLFREGTRTYSLSIRSGFLLAAEAHGLGQWCLSPMDGSTVHAELVRLLATGRRKDPKVLAYPSLFKTDYPVEVGGNRLSLAMVDSLMGDSTSPHVGGIGIPTRVVRLTGDPEPANRVIAGPRLWRRAEPGNDIAFARTLATDIAEWIAACEG